MGLGGIIALSSIKGDQNAALMQKPTLFIYPNLTIVQSIALSGIFLMQLLMVLLFRAVYQLGYDVTREQLLIV
jgi:hypothetical protein